MPSKLKKIRIDIANDPGDVLVQIPTGELAEKIIIRTMLDTKHGELDTEDGVRKMVNVHRERHLWIAKLTARKLLGEWEGVDPDDIDGWIADYEPYAVALGAYVQEITIGRNRVIGEMAQEDKNGDPFRKQT